MSDGKFTCGRRNDLFASGRGVEGEDEWRAERRPGMLPTCSYCGSISPEDFFHLVSEGAQVGPTDKNYKVYIDYPNPFPDHQRIVSAITHEPDSTEGWLPIDDAIRADLTRDGWGGTDYKYARYTTDSHHTAKFYFQHLDDDDKRRFVDLYNDGTMKLGVPGYFYAKPYFIRLVP